ncbi:CAP domain-containing protein [Salirhabdus salicampi]|uniref:CAP domain-containing protein n=1 Tax=Salirhabdus salicampi TaxID=476102 RepID=UPI0020C557A1|nr:CAP domain-containing protein [Salirhabdus salicampi]MCP8615972.1 CAP domain-containing protein [Salirhabdus salicampi]
MRLTFIKLFSLTIMLTGLVACNTGDYVMDDRQRNNNNDNISSMNTNMSSEDYPHTRAKVIQEAKYEFYTSEDHGNSNQHGQQSGDQQIQQRQNQQNGNIQQQGNNQSQQPQQQQQTNEQQSQGGQDAEGLSEFERRVVELTNEERRNNGLSELKIDTQLSGIARTKSEDMQANNYFSHTSPTYGSPFDMIRDNGVDYQSAAENIAQGQQSPEEVVQSWMNSEGHRKNILTEEFTHIGVGHETEGNHWTQMFIQK